MYIKFVCRSIMIKVVKFNYFFNQWNDTYICFFKGRRFWLVLNQNLSKLFFTKLSFLMKGVSLKRTIKSIIMHVTIKQFLLSWYLWSSPPWFHGHFFNICCLLLACFISKPKISYSYFDIMLVIPKKTSVI